MYESLQLKNEFCTSLRNFLILVLEQGDFSKLKETLIKYGMVEFQGRHKVNPTINKQDTVQSLVSYLDEQVCKQQEIDVEMIQSIKHQKKQRSKIIY